MAFAAVRLMHNVGRPALCLHVPTTSTTTATPTSPSGLNLWPRYHLQPTSHLGQVRLLLATSTSVLESTTSNKTVMLGKKPAIGGDSIRHLSAVSSPSEGGGNKVNATSPPNGSRVKIAKDSCSSFTNRTLFHFAADSRTIVADMRRLNKKCKDGGDFGNVTKLIEFL